MTIQLPKNKLPKKLRGWFYLERANLPVKDQSQILLNAKSYNIDRIKEVMTDSYSEKMLIDLDEKTKHDFPRNKKKSFPKSFDTGDRALETLRSLLCIR